MKKRFLLFGLLAVLLLAAMIPNVMAATCNHPSFKWVTTRAATCTSAGFEKYTCTKCGVAVTSRTTAKNPNNHTSISGWTTVKKATCVAGGSERRTCNGCKAVVSTRATAKDPSNHTSVTGWTTVTKATCIGTGSEKRTCNGCKAVVSTRTTAKDPNNHAGWSKWTTYRQPCYHRKGAESRHCGCGKKTEDREINKDPSYTKKWSVQTKQSCTSPEILSRTCDVCNYYEVKENPQKPALGHQMRNTNNNVWPYPESCQKELVFYEWCNREDCPKHTRKKVVIPKRSHIEIEVIENGRRKYVCALCGVELP